ncbi:23751_t:CDS:10 [Dentiscutata erythropus]|uniref:23751_t:CDS:1 n=2 Tax=Dentiscutata TaxID=756610 RepID=A0A9N9C9P9_9GLOM|nr:23751_t:CDS:10 [Dentiscutata erythropus]
MPIISNPKNPRAPTGFWEYLTRRRGWGYPDVIDISGSVFLNLVPILVSTTLWTTTLCLIYLVFGINIAFSANLTGSIAVVVGLLLAFRTNNAYDRYNEGRKIFSCMCTHIRNSTRTLWIGIEERDPVDHRNKEIHIRLLLAYVVAVKHHVRLEFGTHWPDLEDLLPEGFQLTYYEGSAALADPTLGSDGKSQSIAIEIPHVEVTLRTLASRVPPTTFFNLRPSLRGMSKEEQKMLYGDSVDLTDDLSEVDASMSLPLEIIFHLNVYVEKQITEGKLDMGKYGSVVGNFNTLIDSLGNLERIGNTPIPTAYNVHLKQAVILYVFALPFTIISELEWFTIPTIFLVAFILFGILAVGSEIENPFGYDENDLPLDDYCKDLEAEVRYLQRHLPTKRVKEISK